VEWKEDPEFDTSWLVKFEVSGITKKVVAYQIQAARLRVAPMPVPTNYYQMLRISPRRNEWGKHYGYDPLDTDEFQLFARQLAVDQMNFLNRIWQLGSPELTTNDLTICLASPKTNTFDITLAKFGDRFNDRFQLQIFDRRVQLFMDHAHNMAAYWSDEQKMQDASVKDTLNPAAATGLAREALHQMGWNEKQLQLVEPPTVKQWKLPPGGNEQGPVYKLPHYDVSWLLPENERQGAGEEPVAVAFQISGLTKKVTMYANNWPLTPRIPLPANYLQILGLASQTNSTHRE
jgi:hypothetical protein